MAEEKQITQDSGQQANVKETIGQNMNSVCIMRRYSKADIISFIVTIVILTGSVLLTTTLMKIFAIVLACLSLIAPAVIVKIIEHNSFSLVYVHKVLSESGLNPVVIDGEIRCICNGKETIIKGLGESTVEKAILLPAGSNTRIEDNFSAGVIFNTNDIISQYCASKDKWNEININDFIFKGIIDRIFYRRSR